MQTPVGDRLLLETQVKDMVTNKPMTKLIDTTETILGALTEWQFLPEYQEERKDEEYVTGSFVFLQYLQNVLQPYRSRQFRQN